MRNCGSWAAIAACALIFATAGSAVRAQTLQSAAEFEQKGATEYRQAVERTNQLCRNQRLSSAQCDQKLKSLEVEKQKFAQAVSALRKVEQDKAAANQSYVSYTSGKLASIQPRGAPPLTRSGGDVDGLRRAYAQQLASLKNSCGKGRDPNSPVCKQADANQQEESLKYQEYLQRLSVAQQKSNDLSRMMHDLMRQVVQNWPSR